MRQPRRGPRPPNDVFLNEVNAEIAELQEWLSAMKQTSNLAAHDKVMWYRAMMYATAQLRDNCIALGSRLAANSVIEEAASRRLAADIIGMHQVTIARWLKEFPDPTQVQPLRDPQNTEQPVERYAHEFGKVLVDETIDGSEE